MTLLTTFATAKATQASVGLVTQVLVGRLTQGLAALLMTALVVRATQGWADRSIKALGVLPMTVLAVQDIKALAVLPMTALVDLPMMVSAAHVMQGLAARVIPELEVAGNHALPYANNKNGFVIFTGKTKRAKARHVNEQGVTSKLGGQWYASAVRSVMGSL